MITNKDLITAEDIRLGIVIPVNKDLDWTSFDVVKKIKRLFHLKKVGHAGTLDPKATGLLLIATENKTKEINSLMGLDKEYLGVMHFGAETESGDTETEKIKEYDISNISSEQIYNTTKNFVGEIDQIPPMYSAIKMNGKPLYKLARKGQEVNRIPKKVIIYKFEINQISIPEIKFTIACSKGTYIRSLVNDFAKSLGVGAFLKSLERIRIGGYHSSGAFSIDDLIKIKYHEKAAV
jgi:tRNA pseudouridine55 synthase